MTVLVDTSVWSLALRRDALPGSQEVNALRHPGQSTFTGLSGHFVQVSVH